ncbi:MAG: rhomboid family intramembrane serine protease [Gammaproteobacteria bacterium]|nr:rhomboid family intramembrane serine protease [Gammaproteobacteria bacterium]MBU2435683.1 rhomboid family intramembrane serine protease [Gammaproteobacteria bacterium]MBU2449536.1 rhomboid family intramembrane serine protease [Gammaproteobacteria bacterium]
MFSLHDQLRLRVPQLRLTPLLMAANVLVFGAMLLSGAGLWHSQNGVQLAWGANFGPATQDGEWWRLGSAMFLHFGLLHLALNMWALWDGGQWVERMYGHFRFAAIYFVAGLTGNLLSLVFHQGHAVSGGASGAIFGLYGALLSYLWLERSRIQRGEFRWLFWAAVGFSVVSIVFGLMVPGIDNAAHIGGLIGGLLMGILIKPEAGDMVMQRRAKLTAGLVFVALVGVMAANVPQLAYRWSDEKQVQQEIGEFLQEDAAISRAWESILRQGERKGASFEELADVIESVVADRYEHSFEELAALPRDANLPSALAAERVTRYAEQRRDASRAMVEGLRAKDRVQIRKALEQARQSRTGQ